MLHKADAKIKAVFAVCLANVLFLLLSCAVSGAAGQAVLQVPLQGAQPVHVEARQADAARAEPHVGLQSVSHSLPGEREREKERERPRDYCMFTGETSRHK